MQAELVLNRSDLKLFLSYVLSNLMNATPTNIHQNLLQ